MNKWFTCRLACLLTGIVWGAGIPHPFVGAFSPQEASSGGAYTTAQAERGKVVYAEHCSNCHGPSMRGGANDFGAPPLAGPFFFEKWNGRPIGELHSYSVENMPPGEAKPPAAAYVDVTAYILQVLKYPAGTAELTADSPIMKQPFAERP